jgi:hypothetical protein
MQLNVQVFAGTKSTPSELPSRRECTGPKM